MVRCKVSCPRPSITWMQAVSPTAPFGRGQRQRLEGYGTRAGKARRQSTTERRAMHQARCMVLHCEWNPGPTYRQLGAGSETINERMAEKSGLG